MHCSNILRHFIETVFRTASIQLHRAAMVLLFGVITVFQLNAQEPPAAAEYTYQDSINNISSKLREELSQQVKDIEGIGNKYQVYIDRINVEPNITIVCDLIAAAHRVGFETDDQLAALDTFRLVFPALDYARFHITEQTYIEYLFVELLAFDGNINDAEVVLLDILNRPDSLVDEFTYTSAHYMAAYCSYYTDQLERSAYHAKTAAEGFQKMGNVYRAVEGFDGASTTFYRMGEIDSAVHFARKGLSLANSSAIPEPEITNLYLNYSEALMAIGKVDSAFFYANKANTIISQFRENSEMARSQYTLANIISASGRKNKAIEYYKNAFNYFAKGNEPYHQLDVLDSLSKTYMHLGDYKNAYQTASRGFQLRDSLREERIQKDADKIVAEYQRDVLKKELRASKGERALAQAVLKKRQYERLAMIGVVCSMALFILFIYYRAVTRKKLAQDLKAQVKERTAVLREHSKQLEIQTIQLTESNAELERFAYIASHDLKTPLRNVTSFVGLIQRRLPADARLLVQEYIDIALDNAKQMHNLVTDVLEYSKLNSKKQEETEEVLVSETVEQIGQRLCEDMQIEKAVIRSHGDVTIALPEGALEQMLSNIMSNALKYNESKIPRVDVFVTKMDDRLRISVKDNGIGIDPLYHDRIFEVFRRLHTTDRYTGTGVGLAASRKVAARLEGHIFVDSKVGEGSTFHIDIPIMGDIRILDKPQKAVA